MSADLGPLAITRRSSSEPIRAGGETVGRLGDFWSWACSDLANNTMRGVLAEYLVATALDAAAGTRTEWDTVDIRTPDKWRVEVKSAAYLQSWAQPRQVGGRSLPQRFLYGLSGCTGFGCLSMTPPDCDHMVPSGMHGKTDKPHCCAATA